LVCRRPPVTEKTLGIDCKQVLKIIANSAKIETIFQLSPKTRFNDLGRLQIHKDCQSAKIKIPLADSSQRVARDFVNLRSLPLIAAALKRGQAPRSTNCSNAVGTALQGEPALPKRI